MAMIGDLGHVRDWGRGNVFFYFDWCIVSWKWY